MTNLPSSGVRQRTTHTVTSVALTPIITAAAVRVSATSHASRLTDNVTSTMSYSASSVSLVQSALTSSPFRHLTDAEVVHNHDHASERRTLIQYHNQHHLHQAYNHHFRSNQCLRRDFELLPHHHCYGQSSAVVADDRCFTSSAKLSLPIPCLEHAAVSAALFDSSIADGLGAVSYASLLNRLRRNLSSERRPPSLSSTKPVSISNDCNLTSQKLVHSIPLVLPLGTRNQHPCLPRMQLLRAHHQRLQQHPHLFRSVETPARHQALCAGWLTSSSHLPTRLALHGSSDDVSSAVSVACPLASTAFPDSYLDESPPSGMHSSAGTDALMSNEFVLRPTLSLTTSPAGASAVLPRIAQIQNKQTGFNNEAHCFSSRSQDKSINAPDVPTLTTDVSRSQQKIQQLDSPFRPETVFVSAEERLDGAERQSPAHHSLTAAAATSFTVGSVIDLGSGEWKPVEGLRTDDFMRSAETNLDLRLDTSIVIHMEHDHESNMVVLGFAVGRQGIEVTVEATFEHPFFVYDRGWSSCCPDQTMRLYGLPCQRLAVGDCCIALTPRENTAVSDASDCIRVLSSPSGSRNGTCGSRRHDAGWSSTTGNDASASHVDYSKDPGSFSRKDINQFSDSNDVDTFPTLLPVDRQHDRRKRRRLESDSAPRRSSSGVCDAD